MSPQEDSELRRNSRKYPALTVTQRSVLFWVGILLFLAGVIHIFLNPIEGNITIWTIVERGWIFVVALVLCVPRRLMDILERLPFKFGKK